MAASDSQSVRLSTFDISPEEQASLAALEFYARDRLPDLLGRLHDAFAQWPSIHRAVQDPDVHRLRVAHWCRVVSGQLDVGFEQSAHELAEAFYQHGVPAYAVAICHASVTAGIVRDLGLDKRSWRAAAKRDAMRTTLTKLAWLDLELLLESYAKSESRTRAAALTAMAETIERETSNAVEQVGGLTGEMSGIARTMGQTASVTGQTASRASAVAGQTLESVRQVTAAANQLSKSVHEISRQVVKSREAADLATSCGEQANASIEALSDQAAQIGQIAGTIAGIASRTNLLALNATIEAARAGEAGRGFAVVAGEVKSLAAQTSSSTDDINSQIAAIQAATNTAAERVRSMVGTIDDLQRICVAVASAVEQQNAATGEIARNMDETAKAVTVMTGETERVSASAEEADHHASDVLTRADSLRQAVQDLQRIVVRVIRTSTSEVNRRRSERQPIALRVRFTPANAAPIDTETVDISFHGVSLRTAATLPANMSGRLSLAGLDVTATVLRADETGHLCLSFDLTEAQRERLATHWTKLAA